MTRSEVAQRCEVKIARIRMEKRVYGRYKPREIPNLPIVVTEITTNAIGRPVKRRCENDFTVIDTWKTVQYGINSPTIFRQTSERFNLQAGNFHVRFLKQKSREILNDTCFNMIVNIYNAKKEVLGFTNFMVQSSEGQLHLKSARNYFTHDQYTGTPMCVVEPLEPENRILGMVSDFDFIVITRPNSLERFFEIVTTDGFSHSWSIEECGSAETWIGMMRQAVYMDLDTRFGNHLGLGRVEDEERYAMEFAVL